MGIFDFFKKKEKERVNFRDMENVNNILYYKEAPFTGIGYELYDNGKIKEEFDIIKGIKHGNSAVFSKEKIGKNVIHMISTGSYKEGVKDGLFMMYDEFYNDWRGKEFYKDGVGYMVDHNGGVTKPTVLPITLEEREEYMKEVQEKNLREKKDEISRK